MDLDTHALNKVLADIAGIEVVWLPDPNDEAVSYWVTKCEGEYGDEWNPLTDHNQMALVKAELRKAGKSYRAGWNGALGLYKAWIYEPGYFDDRDNRIEAVADDELRALAMAVQAMQADRQEERDGANS